MEPIRKMLNGRAPDEVNRTTPLAQPTISRVHAPRTVSLAVEFMGTISPDAMSIVIVAPVSKSRIIIVASASSTVRSASGSTALGTT
eukprot:m.283186 g.283186  ORF g.283186 m.283186 type:complete len:87 (-) comp26997_c0_seq16:950-1210(-)